MLDLMRIHYGLMRRYERYFLFPLYRKLMSRRVKNVRKKKVINVLFIITEVGPWKTKELYKLMLSHPRFNPSLGVTYSMEVPSSKAKLMDYLQDNNFDFVDLDVDTYDAFVSLSPDIIFYQKPYDGCYKYEMRYRNHLNSLFCNVNYGFHCDDTSWAVNQPLYENVWQQYYENELLITPKRLAMMPDKGKQIVVTGLPIQDQFIQNYTSATQDPWKKREEIKKRIIFAPHHTIGNMHLSGLAISSFLETGEFMLEMMRKYSNQVQWAFKPHPLLYSRLVTVWGKEKTDNYYKEWKLTENSQFENGEYYSLFKYSDAMIHDCDSFTVEYFYAHNPILYLERQENAETTRSELCQRAYDLHYKGSTKEQIEKFIQNVIQGIDPMKEEREKFYHEYLIPPHGKTACENIINAILGEAEYRGI